MQQTRTKELPAFGKTYTVIADIPEFKLKNAKINFLPTEPNSKIMKKLDFF